MIPKIIQNSDQAVQFEIKDTAGLPVVISSIDSLLIQAIRDDGFELQEFSTALNNIETVNDTLGIVKVILSRENLTTDRNRFVSFRVTVNVADMDYFNGIKSTVLDIKNVFELCK
jgi:hypothetical protein